MMYSVHHFCLFSVAIECVRLTSPLNGFVSLEGVRLGSEATYSCEEGFGLTGGSSTRVCESDGDWSGTAPICKSKYYMY